MGLKVIERSRAGEVIWASPLPKTAHEREATKDKLIFGPDGVHPYSQTAGAMYVDALKRCLSPMLRAKGVSSSSSSSSTSSSSSASQGSKSFLPKPIDDMNWERMQMVMTSSTDQVFTLGPRVSSLNGSDPRHKVASKHGIEHSYLMQAPGDTISLGFTGKHVGIYGIVGPWTGNLMTTLDGGTPTMLQTFGTFNHFSRPSHFTVADDLGDEPHRLILDVSGAVPEKGAVVARINPKVLDPGDIKKTDYILAGVCITGEVLYD